MENFGLYLMVGSMFGLFGWALLEYLKAGYDFWRQRKASAGDAAAPAASSLHGPLADGRESTEPAAATAATTLETTEPLAH